MPATPTNLPIILFVDRAAWAEWLDEHHRKAPGVWLQITKAASGIESVSYVEAVEVALCYGWIDGLKRSHDAVSWVQKFTPRRKKSMWSKINRDRALELMRRGEMQSAGLAEIEAAQQDGRWDAAYDSQSKAEIPSDFQAELDQHPEAKEFFATLNSSNRFAILYRIQTAKKPETRARRIQEFIGMLERHEKLYP